MKNRASGHRYLAAILFASGCITAQPPGTSERASATLKAESTFVWVPALVTDRRGNALTTVSAADLRLLDNGNIEKVEKIKTEDLPTALVVLMQTGGGAAQFLPIYDALPDLIRSFVGDSVHEITLVTFDSRVEQIWRFPARTDGLDYALIHQHAGNNGAAINDAVAFAVHQLEVESGRFRRVVILISQQSDEGSATSLRALLQQIGTSSTLLYSLTFPTVKSHAQRLKQHERGNTVDTTLSEAVQFLQTQTANEIAILTGGNSFQFADQSGFNSAMLQAASDFHHAITLGFQPACCVEGFHRLTINTQSKGVRVLARQFYWRLPPN